MTGTTSPLPENQGRSKNEVRFIILVTQPTQLCAPMVIEQKPSQVPRICVHYTEINTYSPSGIP